MAQTAGIKERAQPPWHGTSLSRGWPFCAGAASSVLHSILTSLCSCSYCGEVCESNFQPQLCRSAEEKKVSAPIVDSPVPRSGEEVLVSQSRLRIEEDVQNAVYSILGSHVPVDSPLVAAGIDSLGAVELRNSLESVLGVALPGTLVFDYPSISAIVTYTVPVLLRWRVHQ